TGSRIVADDFSMTATTSTIANGSNSAKASGGIGLANAEAGSILIDYVTKATVKQNADVFATNTVLIKVSSSTNAIQESVADGRGFGADGASDANAWVGESTVANKVGAKSQVELESGASVTGRTLAFRALVTELYLRENSRSYGSGFYSEGRDDA